MANDEQLREEIHCLAMAIADDSLPANKESRLEELVCEDPRAKQIYVDYLLQTASLRAWARAESDLADAADATQIRRTRSQRVTPALTLRQLHPRQHPWRFAAVVILLTLAGWATFYAVTMPRHRQHPEIAQQPEPSIEIASQLTGAHEAVWAERQIGTAVGSHLMTSCKLQLLEGLIELSFLSGSRVTVQGPAALTLSGQDQFALHAGDVIREGLWLVPKRKASRSTRRSPVWSISGRNSASAWRMTPVSSIEVFDGRVRVEPSGDQAALDLTTGETARVGASGTFRRPPQRH